MIAPSLLRTRLSETANRWRTEASERRQITPQDAAADALEYAASELETATAKILASSEELPIVEFARAHGVHRSTVLRWIKTGLLVGRQKGRDWFVSADAPLPRGTGGAH